MKRRHSITKLSPRLRQLAITVIQNSKKPIRDENGKVTSPGADVGFSVKNASQMTFHEYAKDGSLVKKSDRIEAEIKKYIDAREKRAEWFDVKGLTVHCKLDEKVEADAQKSARKTDEKASKAAKEEVKTDKKEA